MLFYAKNMLDRINVYVKNEGFNDLQRTGKRTIDGQDTYVTKKDTRLQEQYVNWIRRLVYDQWKKPNNGLTRAANILQSLTSPRICVLPAVTLAIPPLKFIIIYCAEVTP